MNKRKINLAVVDDHLLFLKSLAVLIRTFVSDAWDFTVTLEACSGRNFLDLLATIPSNEHPDIVLLDFNMPNLDGLGTIRLIRQNYPEIKILMLTMIREDNTVIQTLRAGANGYLFKDIEPATMLYALEAVAEQGSYYSESVAQKLVRNLNAPASSGNTGAHIDVAQLNKRELEFARLCITEMTYSEIARKMSLSARTIDGYRDALFNKLNVRSRVGVVVWALKNGVQEKDGESQQ